MDDASRLWLKWLLSCAAGAAMGALLGAVQLKFCPQD